MIDRRIFFWGAVLLAFGVLALIGLPPLVLWQKAQDFVNNARGAAVSTRAQSDRIQQRSRDADQVLDGLPGAENKAPVRHKVHLFRMKNQP